MVGAWVKAIAAAVWDGCEGGSWRVWYVNSIDPGEHVKTGLNETHVKYSRRLGDPPRRLPSVEPVPFERWSDFS